MTASVVLLENHGVGSSWAWLFAQIAGSGQTNSRFRLAVFDRAGVLGRLEKTLLGEPRQFSVRKALVSAFACCGDFHRFSGASVFCVRIGKHGSQERLWCLSGFARFQCFPDSCLPPLHPSGDAVSARRWRRFRRGCWQVASQSARIASSAVPSVFRQAAATHPSVATHPGSSTMSAPCFRHSSSVIRHFSPTACQF